MLLKHWVKWLEKKPKRVGREDTSWASTVACVCPNPDEDMYSCGAIRRKDSYVYLRAFEAGAANWSDAGRHEIFWMWTNGRPCMQKPCHQV